MSKSVQERVRQVAADVFNVPLDQVNDDSTPTSIESWDSVQHLNLVLALEQEMNVRIDPEEIERMKSIGDVVKLIEEKTASQ
jgi:acyl carrier protein